MKKKMAFLLRLPNDYYVALGEIATLWSWLEHQIGVLIRLGFKLNKAEGRILTAGMAVHPKSQILAITASKFVEEEALRQSLLAFVKKIQGVANDRNRYVHGLWVETADARKEIGLFIAKSGEQRIEPDFDPVSIARIQKVVGELRELQQEAQRLTDRLKGKRGITVRKSVKSSSTRS